MFLRQGKKQAICIKIILGEITDLNSVEIRGKIIEFIDIIQPMENRVKSPPNHFSFSKTSSISPRSSILQNIGNLSSTYQRSTISTSKSKNEVRNGSSDKSKIKTLPNYERYSMGNNLPFVTVFQTIEIERLSDQIETQRIKLKQYERVAFNAINFQVQIKELSERCTTYEDEISQYRQQLDKMNKICQTLYHDNETLKNKLKNTDSNLKSKLQQQSKKNRQLCEEVERWSKKYQLTELNKQNQIEQIRAMMEKQRKSMIDRQMKDLQIRHQGEIARLTIQAKRFNQLLDMKEKALEDMKIKHQNSQDYIRQLKDYGLKINQYQQKICMLSQQHLRLSRMIDLNTTELDNARKKQFKLTKQLKTDKELILDNEHLRELVQMKQKQLNDLKTKTVQLQQQLVQFREIQLINQELTIKVNCLTAENQKLAKLLKQRLMQIQKIKKSAFDLGQDYIKCRQLEDNLIEIQSKNKVLQADNERLENINKGRSRQFEQMKSRCIMAQNQLINMNRMQKQKKNIEQKYKAQVERIMELQLVIQRTQQQKNSLKHSDYKLKSAQTVIQSLKKQNERLQLRIAEYEKQFTNLKQCQTQLGRSYVKIRENDNVLTQFEEKVQLLNDEISRLGQMLKKKNQEIVKLEDQRIANFTIVSQCKGLQSEIDENQRTINKLKCQVSEYQTKLFSYEQKMQQIDSKNKDLFSNMHEQIEKSQQQLKKKSRQCDDLRNKQTKLLNQVEQVGQLHKINQKQQNRITAYLRDLEDLRAQNKQYESTISEERRKTSQLQTQIKKQAPPSSQQQQLQFNKVGSSRKSSQSQSNKSVISSLNMSTVQPEKLLQKINNLQLILADLKVKYTDLLKAVGSNSSITITSQNSMIGLERV